MKKRLKQRRILLRERVVTSLTETVHLRSLLFECKIIENIDISLSRMRKILSFLY